MLGSTGLAAVQDFSTRQTLWKDFKSLYLDLIRQKFQVSLSMSGGVFK